MAIERLKQLILKNLTPAEKNVRASWIYDVNNDPDPNEARKNEDLHRLAAHGAIDILLEKNSITPEEANQRKARWDVMHNY